MRIVYICDFFHPDAGYHPNLLAKYWSKFGHEVCIFTSAMDKIPADLKRFFDSTDLNEKDANYEQKTGVAITRFPLTCYISGRSVYRRSLFREIKKRNPDVIFVNGNDTLIGIQLIMMYKKLKSGLVTDSHMLEMASENRFNKLFRLFYRAFVTPIILKYDIPVIRTQNDSYIEKCLGIPLDRSPWISFGTDMTSFFPDKLSRERFRRENGLADDDFVVIYAGKLDKSKGANILANCTRASINTKRNVVFLIVGNTEGAFGAELEKAFSQSKYRILRFPTQKYSDLPAFYQASDIAVFPKQCSLSFFDVQACGLPVVFEENDINVERCGFHNALTYTTDDAADLSRKIAYFAELPKEQLNMFSHNARRMVEENYNYETKAKEYLPFLENQKKAKGR